MMTDQSQITDVDYPDTAARAARPAFSLGQLPYRVEIRDRTGTVKRVIAVTSTPGLGYAACHAAAEEHFEQTVTLSCRGQVMYRRDPRDVDG